MSIHEYFRKQAKLILKEWKASCQVKEKPPHFKMELLVRDFKIEEGFCLQKAQDIIAKISGLEKWNDIADNMAEINSVKQDYENAIQKYLVEPANRTNGFAKSQNNHKLMEIRKMATKYYAAFDVKNNCLCGVGKSKSEARMEALNGTELSEDEIVVEVCDKSLYKYCRFFEEYPGNEMLCREYEGKEPICYFRPPRVSVGEMKEFLSHFDDNEPVFLRSVVTMEEFDICTVRSDEKAGIYLWLSN